MRSSSRLDRVLGHDVFRSPGRHRERCAHANCTAGIRDISRSAASRLQAIVVGGDHFR